ncbi:hypothetical protein KW796_01875 [Candidatus Parcubacteria bacterium]|nr:hypothetical protein [Candidatus Parcubacteria bacterium]
MSQVILAEGITGLIYGIPGVSIPTEQGIPTYNANTAGMSTYNTYQDPYQSQAAVLGASTTYVPGVPNTGAGGAASINLLFLGVAAALIVAGVTRLYKSRASR